MNVFKVNHESSVSVKSQIDISILLNKHQSKANKTKLKTQQISLVFLLMSLCLLMISPEITTVMLSLNLPHSKIHSRSQSDSTGNALWYPVIVIDHFLSISITIMGFHSFSLRFFQETQIATVSLTRPSQLALSQQNHISWGTIWSCCSLFKNL